MKNTAKRIFSIVIAVALLVQTGALAAADGTGEAIYTNSTELIDGFTYTTSVSTNSGQHNVNTFYLSASRESSVRPIVMACDTIYGGMTISEVTTYAEGLGYNVAGVVNSDFFSMSDHVPIGIVIENGELKSSPNSENALAFDENGAFVCAQPDIVMTLANNGGGETGAIDAETGELLTNAGKTVYLKNLNKQRGDAYGLYLYTSAFSTVSTRTSTDGWAVRMQILDGGFEISGVTTMRVVEVIESGTAFQIGDGYAVLTAATSCNMGETFASFAVGDVVSLTMTCTDERLASAQWATGCGDILVSDGQMTDTAGWDSALFKFHPRTAAGITDDGSIICYLADGRSDESYGAKMSEVAADLIDIGCVTAVNLDGGGSSAMAVRLPGSDTVSVVNSPSDGQERRCSTYILFVTDTPTGDNSAHRLFLKNDGIYVLTGSSVPLDFLASDIYGRSAEIPDDVTAASTGYGSVTDVIYTAGSEPGIDKIELYSESTGASGYGTIHVISEAYKLTVIDPVTGKAPSLENMERGNTSEFSVSLSKLSRTVYFDKDLVTYSVTGDVGTITENGTFTAGNTSGATGSIVIEIGGLSATYHVSIKSAFTDTSGHWAEQYIESLYNAGIVNGVENSKFMPDSDIRRCDFVLMLWRAAGKPDAETSVSFTDVPEDSYYSDAVAWAKEAGIAEGSGNGKFDPQSPLLREQAFALIYRYMAWRGIALPDPDPIVLSGFEDILDISEYAFDAICSLRAFGMVSGSDGRINPGYNITRAEMSKLLDIALASDNNSAGSDNVDGQEESGQDENEEVNPVESDNIDNAGNNDS